MAEAAEAVEGEEVQAVAGEAAEKPTADLELVTNDEDWRHGISDDLKETADRFSSREDALRAIQTLRKRDSQVRVPAKDASDDDVAAYHKAVGVPKTAELYEFPDLPEGQELTDEIKANRAEWGERFHKLNIPKDAAKTLAQMVNEDAEKSIAAEIDADKIFVKSQEDTLRAEWKGDDYEKNKTFANRAFAELANRAGVNIDDLTRMETKDGRLLMDNASMLRVFSVVGREMAEGSLGPALSPTERDTVDDRIREVRSQIKTAQGEGDSKRADRLYAEEQKLIAKMDGDKGIVGSPG